MNALLKKILYFVAVGYFVLSLIGGAILQSRLGHYMGKCEQYRIELAAASDRQSEITEVVGHTGRVLGETVNSVAELREQLKTVEDDYNRLYSLCFDNGSAVHGREIQINGDRKEE